MTESPVVSFERGGGDLDDPEDEGNFRHLGEGLVRWEDLIAVILVIFFDDVRMSKPADLFTTRSFSGAMCARQQAARSPPVECCSAGCVPGSRITKRTGVRTFLPNP